MPTFEFKFVLDQVEIDDADALYARCKDATLITDAGGTSMDFDRPSESLQGAIRSAIADVNASGLRVTRVEIEADCLAQQHAL